MSKLANLKLKSMKLFFKYKDGIITLEEYQKEMLPLDSAIDNQELQAFSNYLGDNHLLQKSSLVQSD